MGTVKVTRGAKAIITALNNYVNSVSNSRLTVQQFVDAAANGVVSPCDGQVNDLTFFSINPNYGSTFNKMGNLDVSGSAYSGYFDSDIFHVMDGSRWKLIDEPNIVLDLTEPLETTSSVILGATILNNICYFKKVSKMNYEARLSSSAKALKDRPIIAGRLWEMRSFDMETNLGKCIIYNVIFDLELGVEISSQPTSYDFENLRDENDRSLEDLFMWLENQIREQDNIER